MLDLVEKCRIMVDSVASSKPLHKPVHFFPNCRIKMKIAKRSSVLILHIFKIWKALFF